MNSVLKPKVSNVQLVTPTQFKRQDASVMRGAQVQQKTKDGLTEVRDIFGRVEHAFKKRKEETKVLEIEVNDLEKHLDYLENQTQDQIRETAALNLAHVNSKAGITNAEHEMGLVNDNELAVCKELSSELEHSFGSVSKLSDDSAADLRLLDAAMAAISIAATKLLTDMESDLAEAARREVSIGEMREELAATKQLIAEDEAFLTTEHSFIAQINNAIAEGTTRLTAIGERRVVLEKAIAEQNARKQALLAQQDALAVARTAAHEHHAAWRKSHQAECQQKDAEVAALKEEFARLQAARQDTEQRLCAQKLQNVAMETAICDKKATVQHKSQALEQTRAELAALEAETSQLQLDVERTRAELAEARESVALAAKSNEEQYGLACCRMAQLREVHQEDAAVTLALNAAKDTLHFRLRELDNAVAAVQTSVEQQQLTAEQRRNEVAQASQSLQKVREQAGAQRASNEAAQQARQSQIDEIHRLEHFVIELQWEADERIKQTALLREAEARHAAVEQQNELDREAAHVTDEKVVALDQSIAEATAALRKKPSIDALTVEQDAQLNEEVEREMQEQYKEKDTKLAAEVAQMESCREQLAHKLPEIEAQHAKKLSDKRAEVAQALAELTAAEAAATARAQALEEQRRAATRQAEVEAEAALAAQQAAAKAAEKAAQEARALAQAQAEAEALAQAAEAQARVRQEQEPAALRQAQAESEAQAKALAAATEAKSRAKAEKQSKKRQQQEQPPVPVPQSSSNQLAHRPQRSTTASAKAPAVRTDAAAGDAVAGVEQEDDHDDLVLAGADSLFTEHSDSRSGGTHRVLSRKYSGTSQRMTPSGSSISSHMLFEEHSVHISTAAAATHSKGKCSSPVHTFPVPYGRNESASNHQHHNTPSNLSQWELSEPATQSKLPPLPPLGERRTQQTTTMVTSTVAAVQAGGIAEVSHTQRRASVVHTQQAAPPPTTETAALAAPEPEDSASASTSASSAERKKAKHKRHKEKQKLRRKLQASSAISVASDSSLNLLQPYPTATRPLASPPAAVLKVPATAPPRAVPMPAPAHVKPVSERVVLVKPTSARADGHRQSQSRAPPAAAPKQSAIFATKPSSVHAHQLPKQHKAPSAPAHRPQLEQESVLRRTATAAAPTAFPQKTFSHKPHKPIASSDWFSEDAPF